MAAKYILALLSVAFLTAALMRLSRGGGISHPQTKTWLLIGVIFAAVSASVSFRNQPMGNGKPPPGLDLEATEPIDDGTLPRIGSPEPGPIGLDSKGGNAKPSQASMSDRIVSYARRQRGDRVGDGQCYTLVNRALSAADAKAAKDYGPITPDADYTWGTSVTLAELQPGDVIQFRDYTFKRVVVTDDDSGTTTEELEGDRPHHTAIVQSVDGGGAVTVWEQNAPDGSPVKRTQLFFTSGRTTSGSRTTTIRVQGTFWFYRPEAR